MKQSKMSVRYIVSIGLFAAVAYVAVFLGRVIPNVAGFLSYEPKDAVVVIAGFILGPVAALIITVLVSFIEMITISGTGLYGFVMNSVSTCAFAIPAAFIYGKMRTQKGAVLGLAASIVSMTAVMVLWNYIITPLYMGVPRETVAGMLATVFGPFNLAKSGINAGITLLLYKPIVEALRKVRLIEGSGSGKKVKFSPGFTILAIAVLVTFVLLLLALIGVI